MLENIQPLQLFVVLIEGTRVIVKILSSHPQKLNRQFAKITEVEQERY